MRALNRRTTGLVRKILPLHLMFKDISKQTEQYGQRLNHHPPASPSGTLQTTTGTRVTTPAKEQQKSGI